MPYDPTIFNINPYYDDFDPTKGFLRVLFKPGYALQAREVTQLQSILQNQLSRVADQLFKDGSRIAGGAITVRNSSYILVSVGAGTALEGITDYSTLVGGVLTSTNATDTTEAKIVHYINPDPDSDNKLILVVDFISGYSFSNNRCVFAKDGVSITSPLQIVTSSWGKGDCKLITVADGIFYVDGFFVPTQLQTFSPYRVVDGHRDLDFSQFSVLSKKIGFSVVRDNVSEQEDPTLRDPAIGSYNYNAPGADRYKIALTMSQQEIDAEPQDFVELIRFEDGRVVKKVEKVAYGDIERALALRTYDESGSYTVKPFDISVKEGSGNTLSVQLGEGKAYVLGSEVESRHTQTLELAKARTALQSEGVTFPYSLGLYIGISLGNNTNYGVSFGQYLSNVSGSSRLEVRNASNQIVARGYAHGAVPYPETTVIGSGTRGYHYRLYLYGISGSLANGKTGYLYRVSTLGETLGVFGLQGTQTGFGITIGEYSLLYPMQPGYAVNEVTGLRVLGKLVTGSDSNTDLVTINTSGNTTDFVITKTQLQSTIATSDSSVFNFLPYNNDSTASSLQEIAFIVSSNGNSAGQAFVPSTTNGVLNTNAARDQITFSLRSDLYPSGFTAAGTSIRAIVPVEYTPTIPSDGTPPGTFRKKTLKTGRTDTFGNSVSGLQTDANGRKYYLLTRTDIYGVTSVISSDSSGTAVVTTDITEDFELDDGQRDTYYGYGRLYLKETVESLPRYTTSANAVSITATYSNFDHGGLMAGPFIGKYSYLHTENSTFRYEDIPLYTNRVGKVYSLANCLDFRRSVGTQQMIKPYGRSEFGTEGDTRVNYTHWLPRIDKLCVKADPDDGSAMFYVVEGVPDLSPMAPPDPDDGLVLATLTVPSYTHNPTDVVVTPVDTKRFTMADIGKINKRVDEVEVFAKLSLSESEISSRSLKLTAAATEPLKTSIFTEEFYGHAIGDVMDKNYLCSVDYERGELRPFFRPFDIFLPSGSVSGTTLTSDGLVLLDYSHRDYIQNKNYTKKIRINPSNTVNWLGFMKLDPPVYPYFDTGYRPVVKTNALMENDNWLSANSNNDRGYGTQWNDWESVWTGIEQVEEEQDDIQKRIVELPHSTNPSNVPSFYSGNVKVGVSRKTATVGEKTSNYIRASRLKNRIKKSIGSRVVDRSIVPYIPYVDGITATIYGLKPNATGLTLYFDGEGITGGKTTDSNGTCVIKFGISAGRFLAGSRSVRLSDSPVVGNSTISAEAMFHCTGLLEQRDSGVYSTRPIELRRQTTSSETISKDPFNRDIDAIEVSHWSDPLSQTFFVDKKTNPSGIFLSRLYLYFAAKDSKLPVTVQIRPTVGGYPSPSVVVPFSTVVKLPSQVLANATTPVATEFKFSTPVYLEPGEYSICLLTNSDDYQLYAADSSLNGTTPPSTSTATDATSGRAGNNQLVGTLYAPQGIGAAVEDKVTDLMFRLQRCEFVSSGSMSYASVTNMNAAQAIRIYCPEVVPAGSLLKREIIGTNGTTVFKNNETVYPTTLLTASPTVRYTFTRGANTAVSPVIDARAFCGTAIKMFTSKYPTISRYVSRVVDLPEDYGSTGLAVFADANIPIGADVRVYYRASEFGETDIFDKSWTLIPRITPATAINSVSEIDFKQIYYRTSAAVATFKSYQLMVELTVPSADPTYYKTPALRNLRAVSFI